MFIYFVEAAFFIILVLADILSKNIVCGALGNTVGNSYTIIEGICDLTYVENYGASFGILSGQKWLLTAISILMLVGVLILLICKPKAHKLLRFSLIAIAAGTFGNLFDRLIFGYVRDFIEYTFFETWFNINFGIGNVADLIIIFGFVALIVYILFVYEEGEKRVKTKKQYKNKSKKEAKNNDV